MKAGIVTSISFGCALLLVAAAGIACSPDANLSGKWEGDRDWRSLGQPNEEVARALAAINLELKADKTFVLTDGGLPFEGNWTQSGKDIDLRVETVLNRPLDHQPDTMKKQAEFKLHYENGKMLFRSITDSKDIELKKKTKPD